MENSVRRAIRTPRTEASCRNVRSAQYLDGYAAQSLFFYYFCAGLKAVPPPGKRARPSDPPARKTHKQQR